MADGKAHRDQTRRAKIKGARPTAAQRATAREPDQQAAWDALLGTTHLVHDEQPRQPDRPTR